MNKIKLTSMITLATSLISMTSVASASTRLETLDGTFESVQAFSNGTYIYEGSKNDEQDYETYYFTGKNDVLIEDVSGTGSKYGMFYIDFNDDEKLFNLTTGKLEDDDSEEKLFQIENNFRRKVLKKADRYKDVEEMELIAKIGHDIFGEVIYEYKLINSDETFYIVYISESGKYIDVSENLNIIHYTKDTDGNTKKVKLDDYDDLTKEGYIIQNEKTLLADNEYIYRIFTLINEEDSNDSTMYAQKISKDQGKTKNGAYIPKSITTYEMKDLATDLFKIMASEGTSLNDLINEGRLTARMLKNSLYLIIPKENSLTIKKYDLKTVRENGQSKKILKLDEDFDNVEDIEIKAYSIDVLGNVWILNKGKISKLVGDEFVTMYNTDGSMNQLSVFNDTSLVAWNTENEIYSTIAPKLPEQSSDEKIENEETDKGESTLQGWIKNFDNTWSFYKEDSTKAIGWLKDKNAWYYLNNEGIMQTGWVKDNYKWYYLNNSGVMQTGWLNLEGDWYYLNNSGDMKTGWLKDTDGRWYYLYENGSMAKNTVIDGYVLGSNGAWIR
ncbi:surface protein PspC [Clostridium carnis]|uniref:Surface protein PspC n=1 Tax=Clostridium carnis TaxID=1530 RepID=A0ABY6T0G8_9CLOT|nr:N-acetylmuramoyl-L-alanine amidase family protein [Clostridium carnis]VDG74291.1 surface protein PspC [Clostridium carnis]